MRQDKADSYVGGNINELSNSSAVVVVSPIDINFVLKGYVVLSMEMSEVDKDAAYSIDTLNIYWTTASSTT